MTGTAAPGLRVEGTSGAGAYAVRMADVQTDREAVMALWQTHMRAPPQGKFEWFYLGHPIAPPHLLLLIHGPCADAVGIAGLGARGICVKGEYKTAGVLADLVVLPEHRTLYPALLLQKQMRQTALSMHSIVYGFPNKNSTPIVRRLGYAQVGELVRYSRVLRHAGYLERRLPGWLSTLLGGVADRVMPFFQKPDRWRRNTWECAWLDAFDARFDVLWARASAFDGVIGVRDAKFLAWRYSAQPGHQYRIFVATAPGETGVTAYAVCEAIGTTLHVRDFLVDPVCEGAVHRLVHLLAREAFRQACFNLSLEFLGPGAWRDSLLRAGLRERGKRMLYASFAPQDQERLRTLDWYVTGADEDQ